MVATMLTTAPEGEDVECEARLFAFLRSHLRASRSLKPYLLAQTWIERHGGACSATTIDQWTRGTSPLTKANAGRLLSIMEEHLPGTLADWESINGGAVPLPADRLQFGYRSNVYGNLEELDLVTARQRGMSLENISTQLVAIDAALFEDRAPPGWVGEPANWAAVCEMEPDAWRIWVDEDNRIISYWMFVNPLPEVFLRACFGNYPESEITIATLRTLRAGDVHIYGPGLYVRKDVVEAQKGGMRSLPSILARLMMSSFEYNLSRLASEGVRFSQICVPVYSDEGRRIAKRYRLGAMPEHISRNYARRMGWDVIEGKCGLLPEIYHSWVDESLRLRARLSPV